MRLINCYFRFCMQLSDARLFCALFFKFVHPALIALYLLDAIMNCQWEFANISAPTRKNLDREGGGGGGGRNNINPSEQNINTDKERDEKPDRGRGEHAQKQRKSVSVCTHTNPFDWRKPAKRIKDRSERKVRVNRTATNSLPVFFRCASTLYTHILCVWATLAHFILFVDMFVFAFLFLCALRSSFLFAHNVCCYVHNLFVHFFLLISFCRC